MKSLRPSRNARLRCLVAALIVGVLPPPAAAQQGPPAHRGHVHKEQPRPATSQERFTRTTASYAPPDVTLTDASGARVRLASALGHEGPILLQFIFTTCPSICPVMSATFAAAQEKFGAELDGVRMISISIDPEQDTPARLGEYARRFGARRQWLFLTGDAESIVAVQKAFDAYRGNKMRHEPLTFLRAAPGEPWVRLDGLLSAAQLFDEYKRLTSKADARLGERIYREGVLPSGARLRATVQGDLAVEGAQFTCAACHRRSGFGSTEGAAFVPAVTGATLFGERHSPRADLFRRLFQEVQPQRFRARVRDPRVRPAYTEETLAVALREGKDPAGRELDPLMPRYQLSDEDTSHLVAYLKSLSAAPAPGVTRDGIHFAAVVAEGVGREERRAMLDVMEAYVRRKNAETLGLLRRPGHTAFYDEESYAPLREWVLHVWELKGAGETWGEQLDALYREQPVFALLGGLADGDWQPVHDFCERAEVPCLFPNTDLPVVAPPGAYTLYFSKGLTVEAEALARHLREQTKPGPPARILQLFRAEGRGLAPARALRSALRERGTEGPRERVIPRAQKLTRDFWERLLEDERPSALVLWLDAADLKTLDSARASATGTVRQVYLSSSLLKDARQPLPSLRDRVYLTHPYALPRGVEPNLYRARAWLRSKGIGGAHERLRLNTYFALSVADHSLTRLAGNFSRDYFVECVEQETESTPNPGVFPRLSLGPGQRFASKGSYIVKPSDGAQGGVEAVGDWLIP